MKAANILRRLTSGTLWLNLLAMLAVVAGLIFGLQWWLLRYTHHGEGIEVPDFYGMDYRKALALAQVSGLRIMANDSTYIKQMPAGCVVVQSPAKGMSVKEGRTVYVTINSLTIPRVKIPDLIDNSSYREAEAVLRRLEFRLLPPKLIDGEKDWVYGIQWEGRNVHRGDMIARESQLTLVIGNGAFGEDYSGEYFTSHDDGSEAQDNGGEADEVDDFLPVDLTDDDE